MGPCRRSECETDPRTGVCVWCEHVTCPGCDRLVPAETTPTVKWVPGEDSPGHVCLPCLGDHARDEDCVGHVDSNDECTVCHAVGGDQCPACGGVRYHAAWCGVPSDTGGVPLPVGDEDTAPVEEETRPERTTWDPAAGRLCAEAA